jgi:hypothetical protein
MLPLARSEDLLVHEVGDELVVYDRRSNRAHRLNRTTAMVWRNCNGMRSVADLATRLASAILTPVDEGIVVLALRQLDRARLLTERWAAPKGTPTITRREAITLGLVGAATVLLPGCDSVSAPLVTASLDVVPSQTDPCTKRIAPNCAGGQCDDNKICVRARPSSDDCKCEPRPPADQCCECKGQCCQCDDSTGQAITGCTTDRAHLASAAACLAFCQSAGFRKGRLFPQSSCRFLSGRISLCSDPPFTTCTNNPADTATLAACQSFCATVRTTPDIGPGASAALVAKARCGPGGAKGGKCIPV